MKAHAQHHDPTADGAQRTEPAANAAQTVHGALLELQREIGNRAVHGVAGAPLDPGVRRAMEDRLGADLGHVRIHADADAGVRATQARAAAFAHGSDVTFGDGMYRPETEAGRIVLAHELAHVVQQTRNGRGPSLDPGQLEAEADAAATLGEPVTGSAPAGTTQRLLGLFEDDPEEERRRQAVLTPGEVDWADSSLIPELTADRAAWKRHIDIPRDARILRLHSWIRQSLRDDAEFNRWVANPDDRPADTPKPAPGPKLKELAPQPAHAEEVRAPAPATSKVKVGSGPGAAQKRKPRNEEAQLTPDEAAARAARRAELEAEFDRDVEAIKSELGSLVYTEGVEDRVIKTLLRWATESVRPSPNAPLTGWLDRLFARLSIGTDVGILRTKYKSYYDMILEGFDRADEVRKLRDAASSAFQGVEPAEHTEEARLKAAEQREEEIAAEQEGGWEENIAVPTSLPATPENLAKADLIISRLATIPVEEQDHIQRSISAGVGREGREFLLHGVHFVTNEERTRWQRYLAKRIVITALEFAALYVGGEVLAMVAPDLLAGIAGAELEAGAAPAYASELVAGERALGEGSLSEGVAARGLKPTVGSGELVPNMSPVSDLAPAQPSAAASGGGTGGVGRTVESVVPEAGGRGGVQVRQGTVFEPAAAEPTVKARGASGEALSTEGVSVESAERSLPQGGKEVTREELLAEAQGPKPTGSAAEALSPQGTSLESAERSLPKGGQEVTREDLAAEAARTGGRAAQRSGPGLGKATSLAQPGVDKAIRRLPGADEGRPDVKDPHPLGEAEQKIGDPRDERSDATIGEPVDERGDAAIGDPTPSPDQAYELAGKQPGKVKPGVQPTNPLQNYRKGNVVVEKNGQYWNIGEKETPASVPDSDITGDLLQEATWDAGGEWTPRSLTRTERLRIRLDYASGRPWLARIHEAQAKGRWVEARVKEIMKKQCPWLDWNRAGPDVYDPRTGRYYELHSGTISNLDRHARRPGMSDKTFRIISF